MEPQWSQFKLRVNIQTMIKKAYDAFATPAGLESWFLRKAVITDDAGNNIKKSSEQIEAGELYQWYWHGHSDAVVEKGKILSANGKDQFSFTFSKGCPVTISLYTECNETIVELVESNLPVDMDTRMKYYVGDSKGWIFYLVNLKAVLEKNVDLRNKKVEIQDVITA